MKIKLFLVIINYQYVLALDSDNCTVSSIADLFTHGISTNPQMRFYLFTRKNFNIEHEIISGNENTLIKSNFNPKWPVRILVHGWKNSLIFCFNGYIKDAYLKKGEFNVIVVDWSDWSKNTDYGYVASLIFGILGENLANFTNFLNTNGNISYNNMYIIGHSLGAQIAGAAGQYIQPQNQYNTIFALDAAGPLFESNLPDKRIDQTDAKYVEGISTNMGFFGYKGIIAHASFYPNYGRFQWYCLLHEPKRITCNHLIVYRYFAESINSSIGFCAYKCDFYWSILFRICNINNICYPKILMGGEPSVPKHGTFYVKTNFEEPFARCDC